MLSKRLSNELAGQVSNPEQLRHLLQAIARRTGRLAAHARSNAYVDEHRLMNDLQRRLVRAVKRMDAFPHLLDRSDR